MLGPTLDLLVGMIFYFFVISSICSAILEWLQAVWLSRGKFLRGQLVGALGEDVNHLYAETIRNAYGSKHLPAYISKEMFAAAVQNYIDNPPASASPAPENPPATPAAANPPADPAADPRKILQVLNRAAPTPTASPDDVARWYEEFTERVSAAFKRRAQFLLLGISLVLVLLGNLDTLETYDSLYRSPKIAALWADHAAAVAAKVAIPTEANGKPDVAQLGQQSAELLAVLNNQVGPKLTAPYQIVPLWQAPPKDLPRKAFGLSLTILAVLMGAPFWFDALNRVTNLRQTVKGKSAQ